MKFYHYDNTIEGLLTCVFDSYATRAEVSMITAGSVCALRLDDEYTEITTDLEKAQRVRRSVLRHIGAEGWRGVTMVFATSAAHKDMAIYGYLRLMFSEGSRAVDMVNHPAAVAFNELLQKFTWECHRFKGFVRFRETAGNVMFAPIEPDHNILWNIMPHFAARYRGVPFGIYDTGRKLLGLFDGREYRILTLEDSPDVELADGEAEFQRIWSRYYNDVTIAARKNEKLRRGFMPRRYWKYMPELNPDVTDRDARPAVTDASPGITGASNK